MYRISTATRDRRPASPGPNDARVRLPNRCDYRGKGVTGRTRIIIRMRNFWIAVVLTVIALIGAFWLFTGLLKLSLWYPPQDTVMSDPLQYEPLPTPSPAPTRDYLVEPIMTPTPLPKILLHHVAFVVPQAPPPQVPPANPVITPLPVPSFEPYTPPPVMNTPRPIQPPDYSGAANPTPSPTPESDRGFATPSPSPPVTDFAPPRA
ncbi:MAG TPA: hypothetical protein VEJ20_08050 [Candidatus Eremiobacteraceae bacterium]|nr:hypothetical protein [Candidatus Eremiobacteraceae bacterium]